jgi:hypothetical protein
MRLNTKHWMHVKEGNFIVGLNSLSIDGELLNPGEPFPKRASTDKCIQSLYELNRIFPVENEETELVAVAPSPVSKKKKNKV